MGRIVWPWDITSIPARVSGASRLALRCSFSWSFRTLSSDVLRLPCDIQSPLLLLAINKLPTTRVPSLHGRYPASTLLWTPPTPRTARSGFGGLPLMRIGCGSRPRAARGLPSCARLRSRRAVPTTPPQAHGLPAACCLDHSGGWQPSPDAQGLGLGGDNFEAHMGSLVLRPADSPPPLYDG